MTDPSNSTSKLFDSASLRNRLMGDDELVAQVLAACVPDINANFRDFVDAIESDQIDEATQRIHAMKGASQNADLNAVSELTRMIEESLRSGATDFARDNVERLEGVVGDTIGAVRAYLSTYN